MSTWKILFLETKVLYWFIICLTFSSEPYLIVQFFSLDSEKNTYNNTKLMSNALSKSKHRTTFPLYPAFFSVISS